MASSVEQRADAPSVGPMAMPDLNESIVQPATKAGQQVYEAIAGRLEWYAEQWEDLYHEAKSTLATEDTAQGVSDILAGLGDAQVASDIPGRLRLRSQQLRGHGHLTDDMTAALRRAPGVAQVDVNAYTGSILIFYDSATHASRDDLLKALAD